MIAWRIVRAQYAANATSGYAARWNEAGTNIIYAASSLSLCALEIMASQSALAGVAVQIDIPEDIPVSVFSEENFPRDWWVNPHPESTRAFGTKWAESLTTAVMSVPSSVIRIERNYILNPAHADFARIGFSDPFLFTFDERLHRRV